MIVKIYISIIFLAITTFVNAQSALLNESGLEGYVSENGLLFKDGCAFPKGTDKISFGESVVWVGGESNGDTFVSASNFNGVSDFQMGPLKLDGTAANTSEWKAIYAVSQSEINHHTYNYNKQNYTIEDNIAYWQGTAGAEFDAVIAPFVDWNRNEKYEPTLGDYPYIYGDQMAFSVYNDRGARALSSNSAMHLNVLEMSSVYKEDNNPSINNVIVKKMVLENKSSRDYSPFISSIVTKIGLGDVKDNYIGTHVGGNFVYAYNGDSMDAVYGENIPALLIFPLDNTMSISSSMYLTSGNELQTGFPVNKQEVYNYMHGYWRNGKFLACGSAGLDGSQRCNYVYSGMSDPNFTALDWSESNVGNDIGERTVLFNVNHGNLAAKGKINFSVAYAVLENYDFKVKTLEDFVSKIRNNFNHGRYTSLNKNKLHDVEFYPTSQYAGKPIYFNIPNKEIEEIFLHKMDGEIVQKIGNFEENYFILKDCLSSGVYFLRLNSKRNTFTSKIIVR